MIASPFSATTTFWAVFSWSERRIVTSAASAGSFSASEAPTPIWSARFVTRLPICSFTSPFSVETASFSFSSTATSCSCAVRFESSQRLCAVPVSSTFSTPAGATERTTPESGPANCLVSPGSLLSNSFSRLTFA